MGDNRSLGGVGWKVIHRWFKATFFPYPSPLHCHQKKKKKWAQEPHFYEAWLEAKKLVLVCAQTEHYPKRGWELMASTRASLFLNFFIITKLKLALAN